MSRVLYTLLCIGIAIGMPGIMIAQPVANFTANNTSGCSPVVVQFTDQSTGSPTSWSWTLGNGTTSTLQNPSTTYTTAGTYTVTLTATNASGSNTKTITSYITVNGLPIANFVASDSGAVCSSHTVNFINTSIPNSSGASTYLWDFGDGNTSTLANPSHLYSTVGTYNVTLIITNASGCTNTLVKTGYIRSQNAPVANFASSTNTPCTAPATVNFNNLTTGGTSYSWTFGDGSTAVAINPSHPYAALGTYTVTLVATGANGCKDTAVKPAFVVIGHPTASFTVSNSSICLGNAITFTNTSVPASSNTAWTFGDGTASTTTSPAHTYASAGVYTTKLVSSAGACADSATQTITINAKPTVSFSANSTWSCTAPFTVQFTNSSTNSATQTWYFGDGTTQTTANPSHTYTATGVYNVKLVVTSSSGCSDSLTLPNYIAIGTPSTSFTPSLPNGNCIPATANFLVSISPNITPTSFSYNYGDGTTGTSATHVYTTAGTYIITYTYTLAAGCTYTATTSIMTAVKPTAAFTAAPLTTCPATNVTFSNTSTGATAYLWIYGDGLAGNTANPVHSYEITGTATVTLIAFGPGGCADTLTRPNYIAVQLPHAQFAYSFVCSNSLQLNFTDQSSGADTWMWHFGDGATSTAQNPSHIYSSAGTDTVILTVHNNATGCNDTYISIIHLSNTFSPSSLVAIDSNTCKNTAVTFSTNNIPGTASYTWNFGDGTIFNSTSSVLHSYTTAGIYTVSVIVTDQHGCADTIKKTNYISVGGPTASFIANNVSGCVPLGVQFTDQSSAPSSSSIVSRLWKYGDGNTTPGNFTVVSHTYTTTGNFPVTLVVKDANGCTDSLVRANYIQTTRPHAQFTSGDTAVCPNMQVNFTNTSTGNGLSYNWSFGDGITSFATTPFHIYPVMGSYTIRLIVTDANSCSDTMTRTAYIRVAGLNAAFAISDSFATCPPLTVHCTNLTNGSNTYTWTFGNGGQSVLANPSTVYTYPGVYHIKMVAHNISGCVDSATKSVAVLGPTGTFSVNNYSGCTPLSIQLNVSNSNGATSYTWDLNNGYTQTTTASTFNYTYTQPGNYIPLVIISNGTCQVPVMGDTVRADRLNAFVSYTAASLCTPAPVSFTDSTSGSLSGIATRSWSFGDGSTSLAHNPVHTYTTGGTYQVRLIISNVSGCTDTIIRTVSIGQKPVVTITGNSPICPGQTAQVTLTASGAATYVWTPGTGLGCTNCASTSVLPAATTTYTVVGTATNGCMDTTTITEVVNTLPVVSAGPNRSICGSHPAQLNATGAVSYTWTPPAGLSCTNCAAPVASPAGTTTYTVTGTGANGCSATSQVTITVNALAASSLDSSKSICAGKSVVLPGTAAGAVSYLWYPATGLSCSNCATPVASPAATTLYSLATVAGNGCTDTGHIVVVVNPLPVVKVPAQNVCAGVPIQVTATGAQSYIWYPAAGLSCSNCAAPFVDITTNTVYNVAGIDVNGCKDTTQVLLAVESRVPTSVGAGDSVCAGTTVHLKATGGQSYTWTPVNGLSDPNSAAPTVVPGSTTTYTVYIKENDCFTDTLTQPILVYPLPKISTGADQTILDGQTTQINVKSSLDITAFTWSPPDGLSCIDCQSPSATPQRTTTYTVTATGQGGCRDSARTTIYLKCQNGQVFIPNIFTPNGDGANDKFYVSGKGIINVKHFSVFNRWGEQVYSADDVPVNDPNAGWDGKYKGQLLKSDVFVYSIIVTCETGELLEYKGDISLVL